MFKLIYACIEITFKHIISLLQLNDFTMTIALHLCDIWGREEIKNASYTTHFMQYN